MKIAGRAGRGADLRERRRVHPVDRTAREPIPHWVDLDGLKIGEVASNDSIGHRSSGGWEPGFGAACCLILNLDEVSTLTHRSGEFRLQPGDLLVVEGGLSLPPGGRPGARQVLVGLPGSMIRIADTPCLIDGNDGIAAVLRALITTLLDGGGAFCGREQTALRDSIAQLVATACSARRRPHCGGGGRRDASVRQWHLLEQSVEAWLSDPALSPAMVAASNSISTRHLHRLFRRAGTSFNTYVRTRRLQRCRDDLADPRFGTLCLTEIAYRWGFSDSSHFSRCFKAAFGCTAREFRIRACDLGSIDQGHGKGCTLKPGSVPVT